MCFVNDFAFCLFMSAFFSAGFFKLSFFRSVIFSVNFLCFGVEGEDFDGRNKKYIIYIDPEGHAPLHVGVARCMGIVKIRDNPTLAHSMALVIHKEEFQLHVSHSC